MLWARVMRGMASMLIAVTPRSASACASVGLESGPNVPISTWPDFSRASSASEGRPVRRTMSASR